LLFLFHFLLLDGSHFNRLDVKGVPAFLLDADHFEPETVAFDLHFLRWFVLQVIEEISDCLALLLDAVGQGGIVVEAAAGSIVAAISDCKLDVGGLVGGNDAVAVSLHSEALLRAGMHQ
jgi:hypothetical protein